jgi:hypothetical protein
VDALRTTVDALAAEVRALADAPPPPPSPAVDLKPIADLRRAIEAVADDVAALAEAPPPPPPPPPPPVELDQEPIDDLRRTVEALADEVRALAEVPPPAPAPAASRGGGSRAEMTKLLTAAEELAAQVAVVQDEVTQLKRRVGVRAKAPVVLDDAQMDDIANRVAGLVAAHLESTFEIAE